MKALRTVLAFALAMSFASAGFAAKKGDECGKTWLTRTYNDMEKWSWERTEKKLKKMDMPEKKPRKGEPGMKDVDPTEQATNL